MPNSTPPIVCRDCRASWYGGAMAHCATCHKTFGGVTGFDEHRKNGHCVIPEGMQEVRPGVWGRPGPKDDEKAA
jgi:hypothetical protein